MLVLMSSVAADGAVAAPPLTGPVPAPPPPPQAASKAADKAATELSFKLDALADDGLLGSPPGLRAAAVGKEVRGAAVL